MISHKQYIDFINFLNNSKCLTKIEKIRIVNDFINTEIEFCSDYLNYKTHDYWSTPLETFKSGKGDCEDYSTVKYCTLKLLGFTDDELHLSYVKVKIDGKYNAHVVLCCSIKSEDATISTFVLDNLTNNVLLSQESELKFIFHFNSENLWVHGYPSIKYNARENLSTWRDVLDRIDAEKFYEIYSIDNSKPKENIQIWSRRK